MAEFRISVLVRTLLLIVSELAHASLDCVFDVINEQRARGSNVKVYRVLVLTECQDTAANRKYPCGNFLTPRSDRFKDTVFFTGKRML